MVRDEIRFTTYGAEEDYDVLIVAYGTVARVCSTAIDELREEGIAVAMVRPITLFPYPYEGVREGALKANSVLVVELSSGQMIEDVALALARSRPIHFSTEWGGSWYRPTRWLPKIKAILDGSSEEVHIG